MHTSTCWDRGGAVAAARPVRAALRQGMISRRIRVRAQALKVKEENNMIRRGVIAIAAVVLGLALLASDAARAEGLQPVANPETLGFDAGRLARVTAAFQNYVDAGQLPGAVVLIARNNKVA